ncbi:hypothetical protein [Leptotrichia hongkongensis]|uniref:hypothetical protein n=1 Tax=Leptotrichia hongkongensis TaxID=554406 RepID=UPI00155B10B8|nr:hypothetical protein [Leptotrichia hongkongensis]
MKKIEQEAEEDVMKNEVEFLRFCFFFILKKRKNYYYTKPRLNKKFITNFSNKE